MAKRHLTRQQQRRIDRRQQQHRDSAAADSSAPQRSGRVLSCFGASAEIEDAAADGGVHHCSLRANLGSLVTGDRVIWQIQDEGAVILARQARDSELCRPDSRGRPRPVAANIDQLLVVIAPLPEPHAGLVDRYLVAAHAASLEPVLVLNKTDLAAATDSPPPAIAEEYRALGYPVVAVSSLTGAGLDELRRQLAGRTSALVGQSGVGKSSLAARLLPEQHLRVGELSGDSGKGTHTTTSARLYRLPGEGALIDSPGIREFGLGHLQPAEVDHGFVELRPLLGHCRFRDCEHRSEPGCALRVALAGGSISERRFASYQMLRADTRSD